MLTTFSTVLPSCICIAAYDVCGSVQQPTSTMGVLLPSWTELFDRLIGRCGGTA